MMNSLRYLDGLLNEALWEPEEVTLLIQDFSGFLEPFYSEFDAEIAKDHFNAYIPKFSKRSGRVWPLLTNEMAKAIYDNLILIRRNPNFGNKPVPSLADGVKNVGPYNESIFTSDPTYNVRVVGEGLTTEKLKSRLIKKHNGSHAIVVSNKS